MVAAGRECLSDRRRTRALCSGMESQVHEHGARWQLHNGAGGRIQRQIESQRRTSVWRWRRCTQIVFVLGSIGYLPIARCGWETGSSSSLTGYYPGQQEWVHGWGTAGQAMIFCPSKCTMNSDFATHETSPGGYEKQWDRSGWNQPEYGPASKQEIQAGLKPPDPGFVQAGEATFCKKPYPVCDYPNGDVFVRHAMQEILVRNTEPECLSSMKHFLCALYRRKCQQDVDQNPQSPTFGNQVQYSKIVAIGCSRRIRMQGVLPVCWEQCFDAYRTCKYDKHHASLMCGEYIKAGWVQFSLDEMKANQCDNPAAPSARPTLWAIGYVALGLSMLLSLFR